MPNISLPYPARPAPRRARQGPERWHGLFARYRETTAWMALSAATRRQRENIFLHVLETAGTQPFAQITTATILAGRERRAKTPAQARNFLDAMRGLFRWAAAAQHVKIDRPLASTIRRARLAQALPCGPKKK